jgi:hypothetical protein
MCDYSNTASRSPRLERPPRFTRRVGMLLQITHKVPNFPVDLVPLRVVLVRARQPDEGEW